MTLFMNRFLVIIGGESPIDNADNGSKQNETNKDDTNMIQDKS